MATSLPHSIFLKVSPNKLRTIDGKKITVYEFVIDPSNEAALKAWAKHFREQYCLDSKIDLLKQGTGKTRAEYLTDLIFPDASNGFGPATRSGDFAEILIADLLESHLGYWVPRTRYSNKTARNQSLMGTDIIGFKIADPRSATPSVLDALIAFESKAQLSGTTVKPRLQDAVNDSEKDEYRLGESLNAIKQRLHDQGRHTDAERIERFQGGLDVSYVHESGAAAVFCSSVYQAADVGKTTDCTHHKNLPNLTLVVVHGKALMNVVHALYARAANEA